MVIFPFSSIPFPISFPEHTDTHFTSRLVALVKMINLKDDAGVRGKRDFSFSLNRPILRTLTFHP